MIGEDGIQMALEEKGFEIVSVENATASASCCHGH